MNGPDEAGGYAVDRGVEPPAEHPPRTGVAAVDSVTERLAGLTDATLTAQQELLARAQADLQRVLDSDPTTPTPPRPADEPGRTA